MEKVSVFIVDSQVIYRAGVAKALSEQDSLDVLGEADNTEDVVSLVEAFSPHVVLLDVNVPPVYGFDLALRIRHRSPLVSIIALMPDSEEEELRFQAIKAGVAACVPKRITPEELLKTIIKVNKKEDPIVDDIVNKPKLASLIRRHFEDLALLGADMASISASLSPRELEVLSLVADGKPNKQIGHSLSISEQTIKNHLTSILRKLNANDRTHAVVLAMRYGLIPMASSN